MPTDLAALPDSSGHKDVDRGSPGSSQPCAAWSLGVGEVNIWLHVGDGAHALPYQTMKLLESSIEGEKLSIGF